MLLALVGLPGSGKSTVGRALARRVDLPFFDSDQVIERELGTTVRDYFAKAGEEKFREIEQQVLGELVARGEGVLSTGGGIVLRQHNRALLRETTLVVYLRSTPDELFRRLRHDKTRPLLQVADPMQKLKELYAQRDPLYLEVAALVVDTGKPAVSSLVRQILEQCKGRWSPATAMANPLAGQHP